MSLERKGTMAGNSLLLPIALFWKSQKTNFCALFAHVSVSNYQMREFLVLKIV